MFSALVRFLSASVVAGTFVACDINGNVAGTEPTHDFGAASAFVSPNHTVHYVKLYNFDHDCCTIAVDSALNLIYIGAGARVSGDNTAVVDGSSFAIIQRVRKFGGAGNVDSDTHNLWLPGLYARNVAVYSGTKRKIIAKVLLGDCPVGSWVDGHRRYAWIAAQCGYNNDPVWVVNADTYQVLHKVVTPGVMGPTIVDSVTGRFYVNKNGGGNFEISPHHFKAKATSFGTVAGVNTGSDLLYAYVPYGLNIIDGRSGKIIKTLQNLPYTESTMAVNASLDHLYLSADRNYIEVREGDTGKLLKTVKLSSGYEVLSLAADDKRGRIYAAVDEGGSIYLRLWKDKIRRTGQTVSTARS